MTEYREILSRRYAAFAAIVIGVLAILAVRLWVMQVLQRNEYSLQAVANSTREVTTIAPRGRILDRNGKVLVGNRATLAVVVDPRARENAAMLRRLANLLGMPLSDVMDRLNSKREAALEPRVIAIDVPFPKVAYLAEHAAQYPYVEVQSRAVREYPNGDLAAHTLGYSGTISESQLNDPAYEGYERTDVVGKTGAESSFESVLQGVRGTRMLEVNASGEVRRVISETQPVPGRDVELTIDTRIQRATERALAGALVEAHHQGFYKAKAGAAVVMDVNTGDILALASLPTYDPALFLSGISEKDWKRLNSVSSQYPLSNRAIAGQYPPASTFKPFTAFAAFRYGVAGTSDSWYCQGRWTGLGEQWSKFCWNRSGHGYENIVSGIADSCDVVFYDIGKRFTQRKIEGIQAMARDFGFGSTTGIDLPGETDGRIPDARWKRAFNEDYPEYQQWVPGDTVNMAIGQGDTLVTPLQEAVAYAAIANGGKRVQPHLFHAVLDEEGSTVLSAETSANAVAHVTTGRTQVIRRALRGVTTYGTAKSVFRDFSVAVAGKTGTAQVASKDDYAWFAGYAPASKPRYAVVVLVEQGGHGGSVAGPAAREIFGALFGVSTAHIQTRDVSR